MAGIMADSARVTARPASRLVSLVSDGQFMWITMWKSCASRLLKRAFSLAHQQCQEIGQLFVHENQALAR
jgi:hypothetical protein